MRGDRPGIDPAHPGQEPQQAESRQRQEEAQPGRDQERGEQGPKVAVGGELDAAFEADREDQVERERARDGLRDLEIGAHDPGREAEQEAENGWGEEVGERSVQGGFPMRRTPFRGVRRAASTGATRWRA